MKLLPVLGPLALGLLTNRPQVAQAQARAKVYAFDAVDQMPHLPSGGGTAALEAALVRNFRYPAHVPPAQVNGAVDLEAVVTPAGKVTTVTFDRSRTSGRIPAAVDEAIRTTFRRLPLLRPGRLAGQPVAVELRVQWAFRRLQPANTTELTVSIISNENTVPELSSESSSPVSSEWTEQVPNRVYTHVEEMPHLASRPGRNALITAIEQQLVLPANAVAGRVVVAFVVTTRGGIREPGIVTGLAPQTDAAVLAAVKRLPALVPGRQNGRPMPVKLTLPITIRQAGK
ncbi:energy transducer TonB [Hymenobacter arizonensis]|uniref:TonB protein C-terminal n=1 Tax=Hymenobacter arizonensis TaxID=1227077 RepID=A0A1I6BMZ3_HYMAR|nr:energy transducer TonB [Hymenobacter arizonensis]SFQ82300.1 TonB protein C-terminal [Hymenobacter arizonensis]